MLNVFNITDNHQILIVIPIYNFSSQPYGEIEIMGWMGKLIGGTLGFAIGGPLGAIAGAAFGHAFDRTNEQYLSYEKSEPLTGEEAQLTFFIATFSMLAKLVKSDGRVTKDEIDSINKFMLNDLKLTPESRLAAMNIFNTAIHSTESFQSFAVQFYSSFSNQPRFLEMMIDVLLRVSVADGEMNPNEEKLILEAVQIFNFSHREFEILKSKYIQKTERYFAVLGCRKSDTNEFIKKQYRKLVMEYHPDRIVSKGLPEEFTRFAQDKFREIQEAYDLIKEERGIK